MCKLRYHNIKMRPVSVLCMLLVFVGKHAAEGNSQSYEYDEAPDPPRRGSGSVIYVFTPNPWLLPRITPNYVPRDENDGPTPEAHFGTRTTRILGSTILRSSKQKPAITTRQTTDPASKAKPTEELGDAIPTPESPRFNAPGLSATVSTIFPQRPTASWFSRKWTIWSTRTRGPISHPKPTASTTISIDESDDAIPTPESHLKTTTLTEGPGSVAKTTEDVGDYYYTPQSPPFNAPGLSATVSTIFPRRPTASWFSRKWTIWSTRTRARTSLQRPNSLLCTLLLDNGEMFAKRGIGKVQESQEPHNITMHYP